MTSLPYTTLPELPDQVGGVEVIARLVDGLAFRYRWATEDLSPADVAFRPTPEAFTLGEIMEHVARMMEWIERALTLEHGEENEDMPAPASHEDTRARTLASLERIRGNFLERGDAGLEDIRIVGSSRPGDDRPFWNMINGPLADALTHVGQINTYRRMNGNPTPRADVFRGRPPA